MIYLEVDHPGALALSRKLENALKEEGLDIPSDKTRKIVAALLDRHDWASLRYEAKELGEVHSGQQADSEKTTFAITALHELASAAFGSYPIEAVFPDDIDPTNPPDVGFVVRKSQDGFFHINFTDIESVVSETMHSRATNDSFQIPGTELIARSPEQLGMLFATAIGKELALFPELLDIYASDEIVFDEENGINVIEESQYDPDCPHCEAAERFADYAEDHELPPADNTFETRDCGHLLFFKPYENEECLFVLHRCDGVIFPATWNRSVMESCDSDLQEGMRVFIAGGLVKGTADSEFYNLPDQGVITGFETNDEEDRFALVETVVGGRILRIADIEIIPKMLSKSTIPAARHLH